MLADKREQDARTTLDYQNEFIKWYGYLRHAALVGWVEERNPTFSAICWVSLRSTQPTFILN
ncbi:hypothetical protein H6G33_35605 [Calothrix sp. FACHB-1219]|uniref:hypothetical protein n=1 Tax=unclassified Calothrix TaxID=2619626 RepID=UPI0016847766|nr:MULTISPECIES: hypothetical protein [unclassified Calothrix]MBD2207685.1 hypothetical protein [Calothrix sp. FACHB-168]MBD2222260.1 hypothetical protein [Calothrix sp. FACHB-1219]